MLIAHIRNADHVEQSVQQHLEEVACLARQYGSPANVGALAELAGFLHDMGKFTQHFSVYLKNAVLEQKVATDRIDHSTAGAKYLFDKYYNQDPLLNLVVETVGMAVLSHHSGMQNFVQLDTKPSDYIRRVTNEALPYYDEVVRNFELHTGNKEKVVELLKEAKDEMEQFLKIVQMQGNLNTSLSLLQKLVFSCIIDADRTNTRCFEEGEDNPLACYQLLFKKAYKTLMETVEKWEESHHPLNQLRNRMSKNCDVAADEKSAIRTLSIPTGGGKTYASLRYALKHAIRHKKSRIIYIVPFTTILEQNAEEVRTIIQQPDAVLEHHANVVDDAPLDDDTDFYDTPFHKNVQLSRDNWDHPIIFTTMVQFLDAFYQKGTRKSRRLHNLTNAILIFDEVQSVPYQHHSLFNAAIHYLHHFGKSTIVLCTATQPAVNCLEPPLLLKEDAEMVTDLDKTVEAFKRVHITSNIHPDGWNTEQIVEFVTRLLENNDSVLIILNTKTAVRKVYEYIKENDSVEAVHLSTSMCPAHRKERLAFVKSRIGKGKVICISTQLIEAGVDISFEAVVRSLAGLDSIAQAAGRCNRNAEHDVGNVYIIKAKDENLSKLPEIRIGAEVTANYILANPMFAENLLSPQAIHTYFSHFFKQAQREIQIAPTGLDFPLFKLLCGTTPSQQKARTISKGVWKTIERYFEAINSPTTAVIVPYEQGGKQLIADLNDGFMDLSTFQRVMKQAQQYSVSLYQHELLDLNKKGLIQPLYDGSVLCLTEAAYDPLYGVTLSGNAEQESLTF
ncbi:CRISPR-associated helicase/endonuclease Cas3 [Sporosarcina sp. NCCP-2222]|uniref:CRISPR-associated helicase Cas3' n=1 Tax=Sporosarcina sp. NCCP-2222 TaxID=2935073 RepID=UPI00208ABE32|nr:CRISPR-associated helicase Cas3' [Sporosarcina sp. NCCP-2222]GKV56198.1 CRISPR-associated helicase/endonuclease Cas3 [Sporosarcina sp. NCCP-2222]